MEPIEGFTAVSEVVSGDTDLNAIAQAVEEVSGGKLIPPGSYIKSPLSRDPLVSNFGTILCPEFHPVVNKLPTLYVGDPAQGDGAAISYRATAINYEMIPEGLSGDEVLRYFGIQPAPWIPALSKMRHRLGGSRTR